MTGWQRRLVAGVMLAGLPLWAAAMDTARADTEVPAQPPVAAAADASAPPPAAAATDPLPEAGDLPRAETAPDIMPRAEFDAAPRPRATAARGPAGAADRLDLDATAIRGNQELPKVLYIVPWKDPELGDLVGKPVNSLVDEVLAPVDREVFRRQIRYFDQLYGEAGNPSAGP